MSFLEVKDLHVSFPTDDGLVRAVNGVSFSIEKADSLCLVGESGCGKSVIGMSIMRLLPPNAIISGQIMLNGQDLLSLPEKELHKQRGKEFGMIYEQPASCLNPVLPVGIQIAEAILGHEDCSRREAMSRTVELMERLAIPSPNIRKNQYPHEYSIGMQQRVMIAIALAGRPKFLIADEPTTALDVTVRAQIVELLKELMQEYRLTLLLITHDMSVATTVCHHLAVMYAGELMELGKAGKIVREPAHPYTRALLGVISGDELKPIPGFVPELTNLPAGCVFHPRCSSRIPDCSQIRPPMIENKRCHLDR